MPDHAMPKVSGAVRIEPIHHVSQIVTPVTHSTVLAKLRSMNARRVVNISSTALTVQMLVRSAKKPTRPARAKNAIQTSRWISIVHTPELEKHWNIRLITVATPESCLLLRL